jgi:hypothetical protein
MRAGRRRGAAVTGEAHGVDVGPAVTVLAAEAESGFDGGKILMAVLGGLGTILLAFITSKFPKGRLEHRLLELQVEEKEREREATRVVAGGNAEQVVKIVSRPILESRVAQDLLLRFVLLYLLVQAWGIVANLVGSVLVSAQFALDRAVTGDSSAITVIGYLLLALVASIPSIVRSLLFVLIGWPLLLDVAKLLRFGLPESFYGAGARRLLIGLVVVAAVVQAVVGAGVTLLPF